MDDPIKPASEYARCRHFTGIAHKHCKAGVQYDDVRDTQHRPYRWPCLQLIGYTPASTDCAKRSLLSAAELAAEHAEIDAAVDKAQAAIAAGICYQCGNSIEPSRIVGRCRYAACGHRIGQVLLEEE